MSNEFRSVVKQVNRMSSDPSETIHMRRIHETMRRIDETKETKVSDKRVK